MGNVCKGVRMRKIIAEYFPLLWGTFVQSEETNPDYVRAGLGDQLQKTCITTW